MRIFSILVLVIALLSSCVDEDFDLSETSSEATLLTTYAMRYIAPGGGGPDAVNYGLIVENNLPDGKLNYAIQARNNSKASGQKFAIHALADGANGTNYGLLVGASNAPNSIAVKTNHGDVVLNADSGSMKSNRNTTLGSTNDHLRTAWGHGSIRGNAPMLDCGTNAAVVGTDSKGVLTIGTDVTTCKMTFSRPYARETSCVVSSRSGSIFRYDVTGNVLMMFDVAQSSRYDYSCDCVGGGGCQ